MLHHAVTGECPSCTEKLGMAHPTLVQWFKGFVKVVAPDTHISWSYRDKASQEECFKEGKTLLHFPKSAHNKTAPDGTLRAEALDLFQLSSQNAAMFPRAFYQRIADLSKANKWPIQAGIDWTHLGDADHFQVDYTKGSLSQTKPDPAPLEG